MSNTTIVVDMLIRVIVGGGVLSFIGLMLIFSSYSPSNIGPLGILVVFLCIYILLSSLVTLGVWTISWLISKLSSVVVSRRPAKVISVRKAYYLSSVVALAGVMLVGMKSVDGVDLTSGLLLLIFIAAGCFYVAKRTN